MRKDNYFSRKNKKNDYNIKLSKNERSEEIIVGKDITNLKKNLDTKQLKSVEVNKTLNNLRNNRNNYLNQINIINRDIMNLNNKIEIINDNINNDTKLPYSVKSVISNIRLNGIHGVLGKLIEVGEKYTTAI